MKILLTGANGLLGRKIIRLAASAGHEVIATAAKPVELLLPHITPELWDITNHEQIEEIIIRHRPEVVIHAAAMTNVDACEQDRNTAYAVNALAVRNLAFMCKVHGIRLVHISTDFVFDGQHGPYSEADPVNPVNYYGFTKLESERFVLETDPNFAILRTVLVYGYEPGITRSNIVLWVRKALQAGEEIKLVTDQWRTPTWAEDLAEGALLAADSRITGVFNISGNDMMDMYQLGQQVATHWKLDTSLIKAADANQFRQIATRPARTGLLTQKAEEKLHYKATPFITTLDRIATQIATMH